MSSSIYYFLITLITIIVLYTLYNYYSTPSIDTFSGNILQDAVLIPEGNVALWMDAADPSTITLNTDGSKSIVSWKDKSTNNYIFSQKNKSNQPTYENNNMVHFTRENSQYLGRENDPSLNEPKNLSIGTNNLSMFVVVKIDNISNYNGIFNKSSMAPGSNVINPITLARLKDNRLSVGIGESILPMVFKNIQNTNTSYQLIEVILDRQSGKIGYYINGLIDSLITGSFTPNTISNYDNNYDMIIGGMNNQVGKINPPLFNRYFGGDICEMLFYTHSTALSETSRKKVENYLKNKWAV